MALRYVLSQPRGEVVHHQPQAPARPQILVQGEPNVEIEAHFGKERDQARIATGDAALNEADAAAGADRRDLRELVVGAQRELRAVQRVAADELPEIRRLAIEADQREKLRLLRAERDGAAVSSALTAIRAAADDAQRNVLYPMREALRARATVGEVCDALRAQWGTYRPPDTF